jgi:methylenetetrahydrofolate reductase (NADPH)
MSTLPERHSSHGSRPSVIETLVRNADIEIIPLKSATEKLAAVPVGTTISVTCSSKLGLDRTLEFTETAARAGYRVIPHLAARQVADAAMLRSFVARLDAAGVHDLYVIGGDAPEAAGPYRWTLELLQALSGFEHGLTSIGVACYPEGHPSISDEQLSDGLHQAQQYAHYMVSQLCFDADSIATWLKGVRADGITLPLHIGLAAPMQLRKLAELSLKIGVGSSVRYLTKQRGFIGNVLRGTSYRPEQLLEQLGDVLGREDMAIERLHMNSFNQVAETVEWQARVSG